MRKGLASVAVIALVVALLAMTPAASSAASGPGRMAPEVSAILATLSPDEMTTVIVTMREGADLAAGRRPLGAVIRTLRTTATTTQADIRTYLRRRRTEGTVARFTPLWIVDGISVTATPEVVRDLAHRTDVASITSDEILIVPAAAPPEPNIAAVNAPAMWGRGTEGQGVVVATLDSGVDVSHPNLASRWRGGANSWFDPYGQHPAAPVDLTGHGTATMGAIVGGDAGGTSIGVSPGATWIAAKIFNDSGGATTTAIHQAFQWVMDPDHDPNTHDAAQIVSGSWSIGAGPGCDLSFQPDLQALRAAGILAVFAAGNYGPGASSSVSPANYPEALAVGAVDNAGALYPATSRGPSTCGGRTGVFPDLVAPGVNVLTTERYGLYQTVSGTSMSAPHAAGAAALLLSARPGLTPDQVTAALRSGASDLGVPGPDNVTGSGFLDVAAAYDALPPPNVDTTPPLIIVGAPTVPAGQGGYFTAAQVPVTVSVSAADPAGISSVTCSDGATTLIPTPVPAGNPTEATGTLSIAGDGTHSIVCSGTDALGNGPGAAAGSSDAATLSIDTSPPVVSDVLATPNPTNTTTSSATTFAQSATATDATSGVARAEWYEGADPGLGYGVAMSAGDGAFGGLTEGVLSTVDYTARHWKAGSRTMFVRVRDAAGNWSAPASTTVGVVLPNDVFADGFESGDLGAWSATSGATNRIAVTSGSAEGAFKMRASISSGKSGYVQDNGPLADAEYHARFSVNPNGYTTGSGTSPPAIDLFRVLDAANVALAQLQYRRSSTIGAQVRLVVKRPGGTSATSWSALSAGAWNAVELDWRSGSSASAHLYTGGVLRATLAGLNTAAWTVEAVRLGPQGSLPKTGALLFDSFSSTRRTVI